MLRAFSVAVNSYDMAKKALNIDFLTKKFQEFNLQFFEKSLPTERLIIQIEDDLLDKQFAVTDWNSPCHPIKIRFSEKKCISLREEKICSILLHEMIHYWIWTNPRATLDDGKAYHGLLFHLKMDEINNRQQTYGVTVQVGQRVDRTFDLDLTNHQLAVWLDPINEFDNFTSFLQMKLSTYQDIKKLIQFTFAVLQRVCAKSLRFDKDVKRSANCRYRGRAGARAARVRFVWTFAGHLDQPVPDRVPRNKSASELVTCQFVDEFQSFSVVIFVALRVLTKHPTAQPLRPWAMCCFPAVLATCGTHTNKYRLYHNLINSV